MLSLSLGRIGFIGLTFWYRTRDPYHPYKLTTRSYGPFRFIRERVFN